MNSKERAFVKTVLSFYKEHGRHTLPWRKTKDPYKIYISEVMLQQTQVDRVLPKYEAFLKLYPNVHALAEAQLSSVLLAWQGLGYNRRAKLMQQCAATISKEYSGKFPVDAVTLQTLPGIGPYTAHAICTFAFNQSVTLIETNVRSVYLHHFFADATEVADKELLPLIEKTVDKENPKVWYYALMDYGSHLKKTVGNPNTKSKHYTKQSAFNGSDRQIRGAIIRLLTKKAQTRKQLHGVLSMFEDIRIDVMLERLKDEGMVVVKKGRYTLP